MFYATALVAAATLTGLASAQNYSEAANGTLYIVPDSVALSTRDTWCSNQEGVCQAVCDDEAYPNSCSATLLTYDCKCTDKTTPNISLYENSLPWFICEQWIKDCVAAHPNDLAGITACRAVECGTKKAVASVASTSSAAASSAAASSSASSTKTKSSGSSGTSSTSTSSSSSGATATALHFASNYGTPLLGAGALALFGLAL